MTLLMIAILIYGGIMAGMFLLQRKLMYFPGRSWLEIEENQKITVDDFALRTKDGVSLQAWDITGAPDMPTIIYFHGNAGSLQDRLDKYIALQKVGFNILALSYRGYGNSTGKPHEEGIYTDARTIINHAMKEKNLTLSNIILYGESLGSGVAVQMGTEFAVSTIVLEAPYISVIKRAWEIYPWLPVPYIMKDRFESLRKIKDVKSPLLIFHNEGDEVIPIRHGKTLFDAANEPKKAYWMDGPGHIDFDWDDLAIKIEDYWTKQKP